MFRKGEVVQFAPTHKWVGCFGIVSEVKDCGEKGTRYMVGVPVPSNDSKTNTAYIFAYDDDLLRLMFEMEGEEYGFAEGITVISKIVPWDPEEG